MTRLHINLSVSDLNRSVAFYRHLFDAEPTVLEPDYAKWMLDDPCVNFSLSTHGNVQGIDHLGLQADDEPALAALHDRLESTGGEIFEQPDVTCCYARSTKAWVRDPDGVAWETFLSRGRSAVYGDGSSERARGESTANAAGDPEAARPPATCCG